MTLSAQGLQSAVGSPRGLPEVSARCGVQTLPEGRCPCQLRLTPRQGCPLKRAPCTPPNRRRKLHIARSRAQRESSFIPLRLLSPKSLTTFRGPHCGDDDDDGDDEFDTGAAPENIVIIVTYRHPAMQRSVRKLPFLLRLAAYST